LYGKEAEKIMPRTKLVTRIRVTGYTYVEGGLNLIATKSVPSPYNPPIKYLASELSKLGKVQVDQRIDIKLVSAKSETREISTFTFELADRKPVDILPGQHAILDFSAENDHGYRHMADEAPQSINDDFVRSWTISSIPTIDSNGEYVPSSEFSCTVKNKYGGAVSPLLHRWARRSKRNRIPLQIKFVGVEGAFTCFDACHRLKYPKLLFIAGGVGITPFMCMLEVLVKRNVNADVVMLFSARGDETSLGTRFKDAGCHTSIFDTSQDEEEEKEVGIEYRRIGYEDIAAVPDLQNRGVYLCGPDGFMQAIRGYLDTAGIDAGHIYIESFAF
jgi:uncharacterized protein